MAQADIQDPLNKYLILWRGLCGACPHCGKGRLFKSYLAQNDVCPVCKEDFSGLHADDGPAWFVMVLAGAIIVPFAVYLSVHDVIPDWAVIAVLLILTVAVVLLLLPRAKGVFIAILWQLNKTKPATPDA